MKTLFSGIKAIIITTLLFTSLAYTDLQAGTSGGITAEGGSRLQIYHFEGLANQKPQGAVVFNNEERKILKDYPPKFFVPRGTIVAAEIMDHNPLLFTYNSEQGSRESQEYKIFSKLIETLKELQLKLSDKQGEATGRQNSEDKNKVIPSDFNEQKAELVKKIENIQELAQERGGIIDMTLDINSLAAAKQLINSDRWNLEKLKNNIFSSFDELKSHFRNKNIQFNYTDQEILASQQEISALLGDLKTFKSDVNSVNSPKEVSEIINLNDTRYEYFLTVSIKPNQKYRNFISKNALELQEKNIRDIKVYFQKKSWARFALAAGALYSFVDSPEFSVKEDAKGNRTIAETSNDHNKINGAVVLNIIPDFAYEQQAEPFFQLGAAAGSGDVGIIFGAGCSFFPFPKDNGMVRSLTVSGGVIMEQTKELASGLKVGDSITTHSELKTEDKWDSGFYLMLGIDF